MNQRYHMRLTLLAAAVLSTMLAAPVLAEQTCMPAEELQSVLLDRYGESIVSEGVAANGFLYLMFASDDGATWTVVMVRPDDKWACIMATGKNYQARKPEPAESGA